MSIIGEARQIVDRGKREVLERKATPRFDVNEADLAGAIGPLARAIPQLGETGAP